MQDCLGHIFVWLLCLLPVAVLFAGIVFAHAKVPAAAGLGMAAAVVVAVAIGGVGEGQLAEGASTGLAAAFSILYAVWPAMTLYDILRVSGAFLVLRRFAEAATRDMLALVLLFGWVFSSFLQSITGFGVPVAVCAPFLVALGVRPVPAVAMTLIGHSWGNTYGTLGMAWDALVQMGPANDPTATALVAGVLLWAVNLTGGAIVAGLYGGKTALLHGAPLILALSAIMGGGQLAVSTIDTTVACFIPSTIALIALFLLFKIGFYKKSWDCPSRVADARADSAENEPAESPEEPAPSPREVALCASPFAFLTGASLFIFVMPGVREAVSGVAVGGVCLVGHAGFVLLATCLFALAAMRHAGRIDREGCIDACSGALGRLWGASAGIIVLVVMARIMQSTGQMQILADGIAQAAGGAYVPLAPAMGTFGAFVTSSNMSSNILLAGFQNAMASGLGVDASLLLAAQTAGGAAGAAIGPSTILLGAATVGATGKEGEILKPLLIVSFSQAAMLGAIVCAAAVA